MNTVTEKKPRLTTSAMIASIAAEGQRVKAAPFGKALVEYAASHPEVVGMTADLAKYTDLHLFGRERPAADQVTLWHGDSKVDQCSACNRHANRKYHPGKPPDDQCVKDIGEIFIEQRPGWPVQWVHFFPATNIH